MQRKMLFGLLVVVTGVIACGGGDTVSPAKMENGKKVYQAYCQACHMDDGGGVPNMNAPLIQSAYVNGDKNKLINIVLQGSAAFEDRTGREYTNVMPGVPTLTNTEIADVLTYIRNSFENKAPEITSGDVELVRTKQ